MENDLKFSGTSPVIIDYNGNKDDIYAPIKGSSCDISIVSPQILDDLYTPYKDGVVVRIKKGYVEYVKEKHYSAGILKGSGLSLPNNAGIYTNGVLKSYTLDKIYYQFTDIDGDLNMVCDISEPLTGANPETDVWLKARVETDTQYDIKSLVFDRVNKWNITSSYSGSGSSKYYTGEKYFYIGNTSLKHSAGSNGIVYVQTPGSPGPGYWTNIGYYSRFDENGNRLSYNTWMDVANIVHFEDGVTELITSDTYVKGVYTFMVKHESGGDYAGWKRVASGYTDGESNNTYIIDGKYCAKSKVFDDDNDQVTVTDVALHYPPGFVSGDVYISILDHTTHTFESIAICPTQTYDFNPYQFFNDSENNLYLWCNNGVCYCLADDITWVGYSLIPSGFVSNSFNIPYYIKDLFVSTYTRTEGQSNYYYTDNNWWDPAQSIYYVNQPYPGADYIWEGYMTPNTYSQAVTQNLDYINMTCIDPVSMLKYVKINHLFTKPNILTYREILGQTLAYVMVHSNKLYIERTVSYGGEYDGTNGLLDLKVQISNFWDEGGEPSTAYDMIGEMLKPFCMTLAFNGESFQIYNQNKTTGVRLFDSYNIQVNGDLTSGGMSAESTVVYDFSNDDWKSNNTKEPSIEIGSTYDKVTAVASTQTPSYSQSVFDIVDYNQRDKYDIFQMNVQRNKTKGYRYISWNNIRLDTADAWYYIWNGVYTDELYHLESHGGYVNGYLNINKAYTYLTGNAGNPTDYGSILNFYGGTNNPTGTGKQQSQEKPVEIHKRITAYAADNGTPLEFLELSDLDWGWSRGYDPEAGWSTPELAKTSPTNAKFGSSIAMQQSNKVSYHQEYDMNLSSLDEHTVSLSLTQSYSRTGIDSNIDIYQNNTATNKGFDLSWDDDEQKYRAELYSASVSYFPGLWDAASVKVDGVYFNRYRTASTLFRPSRVQPVWDKRRVMMYIELSDNSVLQFNGKEWVSDLHPETGNSFYLMKMMNGEKLYHTDFKYNLIETSDGEHYSLTNERYTYYTDEVGGVVDHSVSGGTTYYCDVYKAEGNSWYQYIDDCGEGQLKIKMPPIDDLNAKVCVDIYNSTMLGMTGQDNTAGYNYSEAIYALVEGTGRYWDDDQQAYVYITLSDYNCVNYGSIAGFSSYILFIPVNASYVKAEHLDVDISVTVPESNLGQMFSESDIQYTIDQKKNYVEEFNNISFQVNTYNNLVHSSFSYLIFNNTVADPGNFIISDTNVRPELYTVQAYMNWLSVVRKYYNKTLVPRTTSSSAPFCNIRTFLTSPEVGGNNRLMVISDSWDVETNRHSICAIECQDLDVDYVDQFSANELPRKARAERYNLPTAYKQS